MIRVMFVDDEPALLEDIQNRARRLHDRWDMRFATSGEQALAQMQREPADVIVSDMHMPGMGGDVLLTKVRERYPECVRFILSGQTGSDGALRLMPVAHQVLTKPCDAPTLERSIERIRSLRSRAGRSHVQAALGLLQSLPALPKNYHDLVAEIENENSSAASVGAIIERDVAMTARLLQVANSAHYGAPRAVRSARDAVSLLGLGPIRSILLSLQLFRAMSGAAAPKGFSLEQVQAQSTQAASLAMQMLRNPTERQLAYSAGMLHEIGTLLLAMGMPEPFMQTRIEAKLSEEPLHVVEARIIGCDHAEIGAHMLALWGLPVPIVEAVAYHHEPEASGELRFGATAAVHVAAQLAQQAVAPTRPADRDLDHAFIERLHMREAVAGWFGGAPITAY